MPWTEALCLFTINVLQISCPQISQLTLVWTCLLWFFNFVTYPNFLGHWSHSNGVDFLCTTFTCSLKLLRQLNVLVQCGQDFFSFLAANLVAFFLTASWQCMLTLCKCNPVLDIKTSGHSSHKYCFWFLNSGGIILWTFLQCLTYFNLPV